MNSSIKLLPFTGISVSSPICRLFLVLLLLVGPALSYAANAAPAGIVARKALLESEGIAVDVDATSLSGDYNDIEATVRIKPEHVDQDDSIVLATALIKSFPGGKGSARLSVRGFMPARYRLNVAVYKAGKIIMNYDEAFEVIPRPAEIANKDIRVAARFSAQQEIIASPGKKAMLSVTFENDEDTAAMVEILDKKNVSFKEGCESPRGIIIAGAARKPQYGFRIKPLPAVKGDKIYFSFDYRTSAALGERILPLIVFLDRERKQVRAEYIKTGNFPVSRQWRRYSGTVEVREGEEYMSMLFRVDDAPVTEWAAFDNITILKESLPPARPLSVTPLIGTARARVIIRIDKDILTRAAGAARGLLELISMQPDSRGRVMDKVEIDLTEGLREVMLALPGSAEGQYRVILSRPGTGGAVSLLEESFNVPPKPAWLRDPVAMEALSDDYVPSPFSPVVVKGNVIEVWNRKYSLTPLCLPASVTSAGVSMLNGPVSLSCLANGVDLFAGLQKKARPSAARRAGGMTEFAVTEKLKGLKLSLKSRIEYDGYMHCTLTLLPEKALQVDSLKLKIPVKAEYARFLYAAGEPTTRTTEGPKILDRAMMKVLEGEGLMWQSPFKPMIWLGDDDRGLEWFCDSEANWYPQDYAGRRNAQQVIRKGETVFLDISLISAPRELKEPVTYTFGFMATPVRPQPQGWRGWKFKIRNYWSSVPGNELANLHNYWPAPPWTETIHSPEIPDREGYRRAAAEDHAAGRRVLPYISPILFGYGIWSNGERRAYNPLYDIFADEWAMHSPRQESLTTKRRDGDHLALFTCPQSQWTDYLVWAMREHALCGADGISIFDGGSGPCRNTLHGCGYYDEDGNLQATRSDLAVRNMCKRLLYIFQKERGPVKGITGMGIDHTHYGNGSVPFKGAFFDGGLKGEELNSGYYIESEEWKARLFQDKYYYANLLSPEIFRIGWGKQWGPVQIFFPQLAKSPGIDKEWANSPEGTRDFMVLALLHDCRVLPHWCHVGTIFDVWRAEDRFGLADDDVEFLPYWKNAAFVGSSDKDVKVSLYRKAGRALIIVGNLSKEPKQVAIRVNLKAIGSIKGNGRAADAITNEKIDFTGGKINVSLPPRDYRLIIIE